ncbi:MAG: hypothetical protein ACRCV3_01140 [Desulfovibrionaceae bacterium]
MEDNFFTKYFENYNGKELLKPLFYFDVYTRYFSEYRGKQTVFLEIGVFKGGSLDMWKAFFGEEASIYAMDINPKTKDFESEGHIIFIGDQSDKAFLQTVVESMPMPHLILDDGGHYPKQQITSFLLLFRHLQENGIYIVEDTHTAYYPSYGGGYGALYTFHNFAFQLVHLLNLININSQRGCKSLPSLVRNLGSIYGLSGKEIEYLFENIYTIHFYDSMVIFEKRTNCRDIKNNLVDNQNVFGRKVSEKDEEKKA